MSIYVASFTDAWIETAYPDRPRHTLLSHLLQMRGLKLVCDPTVKEVEVASFTDAWIETKRGLLEQLPALSHLLQMRGLKHEEFLSPFGEEEVASFTDAWIETLEMSGVSLSDRVVPYIGTWIKTSKTYLQSTQFIKLSISLFYHARQNCSTLLLYTLLHNRHDVTYYLSETISKNESK